MVLVPWISLGLCSTIAAVSSWILLSLGEHPSVQQLRFFGAKGTVLISEGESWRIFTFAFVHTSWLHLWANLVCLFPFMVLLEWSIRRAELVNLLIYIFAISGTMSCAMVYETSVGASGLVFGTLTAAVVFGLKYALLRKALWVTIPVWAALIMIGAGNDRVDHASHLGGVFAGVLSIFVVVGTLPRTAVVGSAAVAVIGLAISPLLATILLPETETRMYERASVASEQGLE